MDDARRLVAGLQVTWTTGATIGGSSGSPLIDVATNRVVGVLTGGFSDCQHRTQPDYYGRLSVVRTSTLSSKHMDRGLEQFLCLCFPTSRLQVSLIWGPSAIFSRYVVATLGMSHSAAVS